MIRKEDLKDMDGATYCDVNECADCPRYGDDCDGLAERLYTHEEAWGMCDLISRADAIEEISKGVWNERELIDRIKLLPSAELTVQTPKTYGKSINPSNAEVVEDLISRADVLEGLKHSTAYLHDDIYTIVNRIPSAETTGALDEAIAKYVADGYMLPPSGDLISRADAIACLSHGEGCGHSCRNRINALPSAEAVEVVRCRDCKHKYVSGNGTTQYYVCDFMDAQYEEDGFCHHGKAR